MNLAFKIHATVLMLVNFLLLHYIVSSIPLRFDLTAENTFTLSDSTKTLLAKIEDPIRFDFYKTESVEGLSPQIKMHIQNFGDRVEQMLLQFKRAADGKIIFDAIDPKPDTPEEENAIAAGVHGQGLPNGDSVFLGLVISQGDTEHVIPFFDWNKEGFIEYDIAKAVFEAQQLAKPKLGLITSLPLKAPPFYSMMPGQPPQEDQYIITSLESSFNLEMIEASATELPKDLDMLALIHPIGLSESLLFGIDQLALSGKPMFVAVDPSSLFLRSQQQQNPMAMMGRPNSNTSSDFQRLFSAWGIEYTSSEAIGDPNLAYSQQSNIQPTWLVFGESNISEDFMPVADLNAVLLLEAGSFKLSEDSELTLEPILETTEGVGSISGMMLQFFQQGALLNQLQSSGEKRTVAGILKGEFTTAFPDGNPQAPEEDGETEDGEEPEQLYTGQGNVFIIADTDWALDQFSIRRQNFLGMISIQPINDNLAMGTNIIEFLGGSKDLIGIRSKGTETRAFDRIQAMEIEAQKQFQIKLQEIEDRISQTNQEIMKLVGQQQGTGLIIAGPELSKALQELRENEANMRSERRIIRRELRKDINALKWKIVSLNIGYVPIGLVLFGFLFHRMRKQKAL